MGDIIQRIPVKLISGFIFRHEVDFQKTCIIMQDLYGEIDFISEIINFNFTQYYVPEMGAPLYRRFVSFKDLISPENLPSIKIKTNEIELEFLCDDHYRMMNIDPGYVSAAKMILATTKDQMQRIYLSQGIFAEPEYYFRDGTFNPWDWSYPDYRTQEHISIFNKIRESYRLQIKDLGLRFK